MAYIIFIGLALVATLTVGLITRTEPFDAAESAMPRVNRSLVALLSMWGAVFFVIFFFTL